MWFAVVTTILLFLLLAHTYYTIFMLPVHQVKFPQKHIIFVTGPSGCGKSTVCRALMTEYGFGFYEGDLLLQQAKTPFFELSCPLKTAIGQLIQDCVQYCEGAPLPSPKCWKPFLSLLAEDSFRVFKEELKPSAPALAVAWVIYHREGRDFVRRTIEELSGGSVTPIFAALGTTSELAQLRLRHRQRGSSEEMDNHVLLDELAQWNSFIPLEGERERGHSGGTTTTTTTTTSNSNTQHSRGKKKSYGGGAARQGSSTTTQQHHPHHQQHNHEDDDDDAPSFHYQQPSRMRGYEPIEANEPNSFTVGPFSEDGAVMNSKDIARLIVKKVEKMKIDRKKTSSY